MIPVYLLDRLASCCLLPIPQLSCEVVGDELFHKFPISPPGSGSEFMKPTAPSMLTIEEHVPGHNFSLKESFSDSA
ncbi:uncharacterized protein BCR38DRAFT_175852 [Pseudomassariella vexata]|uniref:Uncharacterized protein n=1 Tax=Pseudomassariella vexata TaxID=1141098 RepID=A0A1Y2E3X6_9PEZI|nr:uncharacterized protein BCR38DRAFT_175852 [Pseudomassariella vexata]ORY66251.1 hypothetical protein BCR38DRAFT_175852 [Pseudomassariella vexata]